MKNFLYSLLLLILPATLLAQCPTFDAHPKGRDYAEALYQEYYSLLESKEHKKAFPMWQELYNCCSGEKTAISTHGVFIYRNFIDSTVLEIEKASYRQKIIAFYQNRIHCFENKPMRRIKQSWHGISYRRIGLEYLQLNEFEKAISAYDRAIEFDSFYVHRSIFYQYIVAAKSLLREQKITHILFMKIMDELILLIDRYITHHPEDKLEYIEIRDEINNEKRRFQHVHRTFDCDYFSKKLFKKLSEHKDDAEYACFQMLPMLLSINCTDKDSITQVILNTIQNQTYLSFDINTNEINLEYTYQNCSFFFQQKKALVNPIDSLKNLDFFNTALQLGMLYELDKEWEKALYYYKLASIMNSRSGEAHMKIGRLYFIANKECSSSEWRKIASLSLTYFEEALKFEDTQQRAENEITNCNKYLPIMIDMNSFYAKKWLKKEKSTVGCVLKGKTIVRFKE